MTVQPVESTIKTRNLMYNPLLCRKQFIVDIYHPSIAQPKLTDVRDIIAKRFKVQDVGTITLTGFETKFGGGKTTGFCIIYNNAEMMKKFERKHILYKRKILEKKRLPRKQRKSIKKAKRLSHSLSDMKKKEAKKAKKKKR